MANVTPVHVPRENVNDDSVRLLHWRVKKGQPVRRGDILADLETSKATFELPSPADGTLEYTLAEGQEVAVGGILCHVLGEGATVASIPCAQVAAPVQSASAPVSVAAQIASVTATSGNGHSPKNGHRPAAHGTRISPLAKRMIEQRGLNEADFTSKGLVRASDVLAALGEAPAAAPKPATPQTTGAPVASPTPQPPVPAAGVPFRTEPLARAKRIEGKYLSSGFRNTLASVVTVACPTKGLRAAARNANATAIILFEAARLLKKYPAFNAFFSEGNANFYEEVNVGFALDGGHGLKVPILRDADRKSIQQIAAEMQDLVVGYLDEQLPIESLAGGTFTVTDLSGEGVFSFHPLINQGQSAILGVGAEFFPPGTSVGMFNLILAFDHQLSEGRAAAQFLSELRDRLNAYEKAGAPASGTTAVEEPACSECLTPLGELRRNNHHLLQAFAPDGQLKPVCSVCVHGWR